MKNRYITKKKKNNFKQKTHAHLYEFYSFSLDQVLQSKSQKHNEKFFLVSQLADPG
jgi:hypothetical protein